MPGINSATWGIAALATFGAPLAVNISAPKAQNSGRKSVTTAFPGAARITYPYIAPPAPKNAQAQGRQAAPSLQAQCGANIMAWPSDQIDRVVRPSDAQRVKLEALQSATAQSADTIKAACPSEVPSTPPGRLAAIGERLQAMLQAVETVQPVLTDFYNSLSDDQKARFNTMGKQIFAQSQE